MAHSVLLKTLLTFDIFDMTGIQNDPAGADCWLAATLAMVASINWNSLKVNKRLDNNDNNDRDDRDDRSTQMQALAVSALSYFNVWKEKDDSDEDFFVELRKKYKAVWHNFQIAGFEFGQSHAIERSVTLLTRALLANFPSSDNFAVIESIERISQVFDNVAVINQNVKYVIFICDQIDEPLDLTLQVGNYKLHSWITFQPIFFDK